MALKIRLRQQGRKNSLKYRIVVADARSPRDGKYVEMVGHYDPAVDGNADAVVNAERIAYWVDLGAQMTDKAEALVKRIAPEVVADLRKKEALKKEKLVEKRRAKK